MSNEIQVRSVLQVNNQPGGGNLVYISNPQAFLANLAGSRGPTPGSLNVPVTGIDVNLSELATMGGMCWMQNLDAANYVTYGVKDPGTNVFYPLGEIGPGEFTILRLSRHLGQDYVGTGTGVTTNKTFHMLANGSACNVRVDAFDA